MVHTTNVYQFTCNEQMPPDRVRFTGHSMIVGSKVWIWLYTTHLATRFLEKFLDPCNTLNFYRHLIHGRTNPGFWVAVVTKFFFGDA
jgi:hypothetical protein